MVMTIEEMKRLHHKMFPGHRFGVPLSDDERRMRHKSRFGTDVLPPRGTGIMTRGQDTTSGFNWAPIMQGLLICGGIAGAMLLLVFMMGKE